MFSNSVSFKKFLVASLVLCLLAAGQVFAASKTYTEDEFITNFSGKTKKAITAKLLF